MSFSIEKLPGEPIIIITLGERYNPVTDAAAFWAELGAFLEGEVGPIYRITVIEAAEGGSFGDMVYAIAEETKSGRPGSAADPRIRSLLVAKIPLARFAVDSLKQEQYGKIDVPLFVTLDEALAYARAELGI